MSIEVRNISKHYGRKEVLKNISFKTEAGRCVGILGANGSGKSTLLSILAGVQKPDCGEFLLDGTDLLKNKKLLSEAMGYVPQGTPLIEELTAKDNLLLWYERERLEYELESGVLNLLGIKDFLKTPVRKMSGGMKKRLSIGCSMAGNPKIILLDEPSAALDLVCKQNIIDYIEMFKKSGGTVLLSTHDPFEFGLCDDIYILKKGSLIPFEYDGNVQRLIEAL